MEILYEAYLKSPQTSNVMAGLQALKLLTGLDAGQSRNPCTENTTFWSMLE